MGLGLLTFGGIPSSWTHHTETRLLLAWNAGALLYLSLAAIMWQRSDTARIQRRALLQHEGRFMVLTLVILSSVAVLVMTKSMAAEVMI